LTDLGYNASKPERVCDGCYEMREKKYSHDMLDRARVVVVATHADIVKDDQSLYIKWWNSLPSRLSKQYSWIKFDGFFTVDAMDPNDLKMKEFRIRASIVGQQLAACRPKVPKSLEEADALIQWMIEEKKMKFIPYDSFLDELKGMLKVGASLERRKYVLQNLIESGKCLLVHGSKSSRMSEKSFHHLFDLINQNDEDKTDDDIKDGNDELSHGTSNSLILLDLSWMSSLVSFVVCPSELYGTSNSEYSDLLSFSRSCFIDRSNLIAGIEKWLEIEEKKAQKGNVASTSSSSSSTSGPSNVKADSKLEKATIVDDETRHEQVLDAIKTLEQMQILFPATMKKLIGKKPNQSSATMKKTKRRRIRIPNL